MIHRIALFAVVLFLAGCGSSGPSGRSMVLTERSPSFTEKVAGLATDKGSTLAADARKPVAPVALITGPMPTGIAVGRGGRLFVCFPRWGDPVDHAVAEIVDGTAVPYPNDTIGRLDPGRPGDTLVSVQSVVCDGHDRLWILDTGSINFGPVVAGGPKLVAVDLVTNKVVRTIHFPPDVVFRTSYVNDVRIDVNRGVAGTAFLTDSSTDGPNGLVVVDLATGRCIRRLSDHPSTKAEDYTPTVENRPLLNNGKKPTVGSDGIALTPDGKTIYYCPMVGHHLYEVDAGTLADPAKNDADVAATIQDLGGRDFASDGLECGPGGTLYLTDYEHDAIRTRTSDNRYDVLCSDARMLWPDSMAIGPGPVNPGDLVPPTIAPFLYFTCNQLQRQPAYRGGHDDRKPPYAIFRVQVDAPNTGSTP